MKDAMTADALVSRHTAAWRAATVHPFLAGVWDGSVLENCFDIARSAHLLRPARHLCVRSRHDGRAADVGAMGRVKLPNLAELLRVSHG